jgi:hypothetical protein
MVAALLSFGIFGLWLLLGFAVQPLFRCWHSARKNFFLAPSMGLMTTVTAVWTLSRYGGPVRQFALPLLGGMTALGALLWVWYRPRFPWRTALPVFALLLGAFFLVGRPMFQFGFDWQSYCNEDMSNYCMGAARFLDRDYFEQPHLEEVLQGKFYPDYYWYMTVVGQVRSGSELVLAWVSGVVGLTPQDVYMPLMLASHLTLIISAMGLVYQTCRSFRAALLFGVLASCSALLGLGTLYQLIAQNVGLSLLFGTSCILCRPLWRFPLSFVVRWGLLVALAGSSFLIVYPELVPFVGLVFLLYTALQRWRGRPVVRKVCLGAGLAFVLLLALLNVYALGSTEFLVSQLDHSSYAVRYNRVFPYYLIPSGVSLFWGLQHLVVGPQSVWMQNGLILAGAALFVLTLLVALHLVRRRNPVGMTGLIMLALAVHYFLGNSGFALFKLAMLAQPFVLGTLVVARQQTGWRPRLSLVVLLLLAVLNVHQQQKYVEASRGLTGSFCEIVNPSQSHLISQVKAIVARHQNDHLVVDTSDVVLGKFLFTLCARVEMHFLSTDFAYKFMRGKYVSRFLDAHTRQIREDTHDALDVGSQETAFEFHDAQGRLRKAPFSINRIAALADQPPPNTYLLCCPGKQSIFNDRTNPTRNTQFRVIPMDEVRNHLVFIPSELGMPCSGSCADGNVPIGFYHVEPDPFIADRMLAGLGRYLLFQVVKPSSSVRVRLDYTAYYLANPEKNLPPAVVCGSERVPFAFSGRGSGRVVSPPVRPLLIDGNYYVLIDLGCEPAYYPFVKKGLMKCWGKDLGPDPRKVTGHGRGLSALSEADYEALTPPALLQSFPEALMHPDLEYSGISEDGWVAEEAWVRLAAPAPNSQFVMEVDIPQTGPGSSFETELQVLIDGKVVARRLCKTGTTTLRQPNTGLGRKAEVALRFSALQRLATPDDRPVAARILKIGFESP